MPIVRAKLRFFKQQGTKCANLNRLRAEMKIHEIWMLHGHTGRAGYLPTSTTDRLSLISPRSDGLRTLPFKDGSEAAHGAGGVFSFLFLMFL